MPPNHNSSDFLNTLETFFKKELKVILSTVEGTYFFPASDVMYLKSEGNYTTFYTSRGEKVVVSQNLGTFDYLEQDERFFRVHQSFIINMNYVRQFLRHSDGEFAVLSDGTKIPVARRKKELFLDKMMNR